MRHHFFITHDLTSKILTLWLNTEALLFLMPTSARLKSHKMALGCNIV